MENLNEFFISAALITFKNISINQNFSLLNINNKFIKCVIYKNNILSIHEILTLKSNQTDMFEKIEYIENGSNMF